MAPNELIRKLYITISNRKTQSRMWNIAGIIVFVIGIFKVIRLRNKVIALNIFLNGKSHIYHIKGYMMGVLYLGGIVLIVFLANCFISCVWNLVRKGEIAYPISENKTEKHILLKNVPLFNEDPHLQLQVEVFGDWIDVTFYWRNSFSITSKSLRNRSVYKKMILIKNNYTYQELDCEKVKDVDLSMHSFSLHKTIKYGKIAHHVIKYDIGKDDDTGNIGINKHEFSTVDITNKIHKWLADNGYRLDE